MGLAVDIVEILEFLLVAGLVLLGGWYALHRFGRHFRVRSLVAAGPSVHRFEDLSSLVTLRVPITDVQATELGGVFGRVRVTVILKGEAELGIDLQRTRVEGLDPVARTCILEIPIPSIRRPRLDMDHTRIVSLQRSWTAWLLPGAPGRTDAVNEALQQAQRRIERLVEDQGLLADAREQCARALRELFRGLGYEVEVRWRPDAAPIAGLLPAATPAGDATVLPALPLPAFLRAAG